MAARGVTGAGNSTKYSRVRRNPAMPAMPLFGAAEPGRAGPRTIGPIFSLVSYTHFILESEGGTPLEEGDYREAWLFICEALRRCVRPCGFDRIVVVEKGFIVVASKVDPQTGNIVVVEVRVFWVKAASQLAHTKGVDCVDRLLVEMRRVRGDGGVSLDMYCRFVRELYAVAGNPSNEKPMWIRTNYAVSGAEQQHLCLRPPRRCVAEEDVLGEAYSDDDLMAADVVYRIPFLPARVMDRVIAAMRGSFGVRGSFAKRRLLQRRAVVAAFHASTSLSREAHRRTNEWAAWAHDMVGRFCKEEDGGDSPLHTLLTVVENPPSEPFDDAEKLDSREIRDPQMMYIVYTTLTHIFWTIGRLSTIPTHGPVLDSDVLSRLQLAVERGCTVELHHGPRGSFTIGPPGLGLVTHPQEVERMLTHDDFLKIVDDSTDMAYAAAIQKMCRAVMEEIHAAGAAGATG